MPINRRGFLSGILVASIAPAIVKTSSLMPIFVPRIEIIRHLDWNADEIEREYRNVWISEKYVWTPNLVIDKPSSLDRNELVQPRFELKPLNLPYYNR